MPTEVVGVKEVMKGLSFIDEDMYNRIKKVLDPQMRQVEATAKGYVPSNAEVLSGWSKPVSSQIDYRPFPKYNADSVRGGIGYKEGQNNFRTIWDADTSLSGTFCRYSKSSGSIIVDKI